MALLIIPYTPIRSVLWIISTRSLRKNLLYFASRHVVNFSTRKKKKKKRKNIPSFEISVKIIRSNRTSFKNSRSLYHYLYKFFLPLLANNQRAKSNPSWIEERQRIRFDELIIPVGNLSPWAQSIVFSFFPIAPSSFNRSKFSHVRLPISLHFPSFSNLSSANCTPQPVDPKYPLLFDKSPIIEWANPAVRNRISPVISNRNGRKGEEAIGYKRRGRKR